MAILTQFVVGINTTPTQLSLFLKQYSESQLPIYLHPHNQFNIFVRLSI
jgi:hypothetical protein